VFLILGVFVWPILLALTGGSDDQSQSNHQVFIAFGFHVNLYHSFRNDTNDDSGFGKDIRIIRNIISTLDRFNTNGIPVIGVWDFDNLFSLQEILPQYAPDIIKDIRRRVQYHGDEVILMSYNNGLVSAMTEQELDDAVRWSISNPWQSGVLDLFGKYSPIVRPQEMMTTPGSFSIYKKHGVQAMSLYYSATPFDAIRAFTRPLTWQEAHNPILYLHPKTKEEMVIIPTYHFGDLVEHVSLKQWAQTLRDRQNKGEFNKDALIFINFDADSELWDGIDIPWFLEWLPGTGGLSALVDEVLDIPGVQFTTVGDYLANHPPVSTFSFSQDTADGSFNGYNSWAEKADTAHYWTAIERSRRFRAAALKAMTILKKSIDVPQLERLIALADVKRLRALSTTHFGMATPFVARQRELSMAAIVNDLEGYSDQIEYILAQGLQKHLKQHPLPMQQNSGLTRLDTLLVLQKEQDGLSGGGRFLKVSPPRGYKDGMRLTLVGSEGNILPTLNLGIGADASPSSSLLKLYIAEEEATLTDGIYHLCATDGYQAPFFATGGRMQANLKGVTNDRLAIRFEKGQIKGIYLDGVRQVDAGSLLPHLKWGGRIYRAQGATSAVQVGADGRTTSLRVTGLFPGPAGHTLSDGWLVYQFTLIDDLPYLMVQARIQYPSTQKEDWFKAASPGLMRQVDLNWQEVAPAEIRFAPPAARDDPIRILKHNYLDVATEFVLDYFRYDEQNLNLDNVNNHITASYVGLVAGKNAMAIAMDTSAQSNFAFAPMRLRYHADNASFTVRANPFGTYHGRQYRSPTWGNGNGFDATLIAGEQFASAGPTYNGVVQDFSMMLAFFDGPKVPENIRKDLIGFAHQPVVVSSTCIEKDRQPTPPPAPPQGFFAAYIKGAVHFGWDNSRDLHGHYRIYCGLAPERYGAVYSAKGNSLRVNHYINDQPFVAGQSYVATIEQVSDNGQVSERARQIQFVIRPLKEVPLKAPLKLELKVLWANLRALLM
jgi:hypothetical protein